MNKPKAEVKPESLFWPQFRLSGILGDYLPSRMDCVHKLEKGCVDLHIRKWGHRVTELQESLGSLLAPEMQLVQATESAAIRIEVPVVDCRAEFKPQESLVLEGLRAAEKILRWANVHRTTLEDILADEPSGGAP